MKSQVANQSPGFYPDAPIGWEGSNHGERREDVHVIRIILLKLLQKICDVANIFVKNIFEQHASLGNMVSLSY